jgi:hypothetical protein
MNDKRKRLMGLAVLCLAAYGQCTVIIGEGVTQGTWIAHRKDQNT